MEHDKLHERVEAIKKLADGNGCGDNVFFTTTLDRYLVQIEMLDALKEEIDESGLTVKKSYVKGKTNLYASPCLQAYNRTTDSANKTVATLMRIIKSFGSGENEDRDPLMDLINGGDGGDDA